MRDWHHILLVVLVLLLASCSAPRGEAAAAVQAAMLSTDAQSSTPPAPPDGLVMATSVDSINPVVLPEQPPASCPVTQPPQPPFTPPPPYLPEAPVPNRFWYGTAALWTMLPADGTWGQLAHGEKVFWWREGYNGQVEPEPKLTVTGKRLDAQAPVMQVGPPATNAYHPDFHWAMLVGVDLPTGGCWEITGNYQSDELSFVVWVARESNRYSPYFNLDYYSRTAAQ